MRLVITTLVYKRPEIFNIWASCIQRLKKRSLNKVTVVVCGSELDPCKDISLRNGFEYVLCPNSVSLGKKANIRLWLVKNYTPDYVLFLGSDDIMSLKTFRYLEKQMSKGLDEICSMDLYVHDSESKITVYSEGYINHRKGEPMAVGRCLSKKVLDSVNWKLWSDETQKSMDGNSRKTLTGLEHSRHYYYLKDKGLVILDIKGKDSYNSFKIGENHTEIRLEDIKLPETKKILSL